MALADQDDVWYPGKLAVLEWEFDMDPTVSMVFSDGDLIDADGAPLGRRLWDTRLIGRTLRHHPVVPEELFARRALTTGATMAVRRRVVDAAVPFPPELDDPDAPMRHDRWLSLVAAAVGTVRAISDPLVALRVHPDQETGVLVGAELPCPAPLGPTGAGAHAGARALRSGRPAAGRGVAPRRSATSARPRAARHRRAPAGPRRGRRPGPGAGHGPPAGGRAATPATRSPPSPSPPTCGARCATGPPGRPPGRRRRDGPPHQRDARRRRAGGGRGRAGRGRRRQHAGSPHAPGDAARHARAARSRRRSPTTSRSSCWSGRPGGTCGGSCGSPGPCATARSTCSTATGGARCSSSPSRALGLIDAKHLFHDHYGWFNLDRRAPLALRTALRLGVDAYVGVDARLCTWATQVADVPQAHLPLPQRRRPRAVPGRAPGPLRAQLGARPDQLVLVSLANLRHPKDHPALLRAVGELPPEVRDRFRVGIVGATGIDGPTRRGAGP
ncbi:MAG: hypothetical protein R2711_09425 [Acidimicrobiales bacterium]